MASNKPAPKAPFVTSPAPGSPVGAPSFGPEAPFNAPYGSGPYGSLHSPEASQHAYAAHVPQQGGAGHGAGAGAGQGGYAPAADAYQGGYGQGQAFTAQHGQGQGQGVGYGYGYAQGQQPQAFGGHQGYGQDQHQHQYGPHQGQGQGEGQYGGVGGQAGDTGGFPAVGATGSFAAVTDTGSFAAVGDTGSFPAVGDTGSFAAVRDTGSFPAVGDTGSFAAVGGTGSFAAVGDTAVGGIPVFQDGAPAGGGPSGTAPAADFPASDTPASGNPVADDAADASSPRLAKGPLDGPLNTVWEFGAAEGSATSISQLRGKHRVIKQRSALARSSTVLGVGVIAAVGAGGIAAAQGKAPVSISVPDAIADHIPQRVASLPVVGSLMPDEKPEPQAVLASAPLTTAGVTTADVRHGATDAGEALRARILQQASAQQQAADDARQAEAEQAAAHAAQAAAAKAQATAEKKAEEAKKKAAEAKKKAEEEAKAKAEAARLAELAKSYTLPVVSYTITGQFGDPGSLWSSGYHTGLDFAAPTGTPIKAVHGGTVTSAGWAGAYGYRTVVKLDDGEELWYCHQSSMLVSVGQKVSTGDVIGRVGATGNVTGPHLHLEVRTTAGTAIDPAPWLEDHGLKP